jgi:hypothetical protein
MNLSTTWRNEMALLDRARLKAIRQRLGHIANPDVNLHDTNAIIRELAGFLHEVMQTPHEDAVEEEMARATAESGVQQPGPTGASEQAAGAGSGAGTAAPADDSGKSLEEQLAAVRASREQDITRIARAYGFDVDEGLATGYYEGRFGLDVVLAKMDERKGQPQ